MNEPDEFPNCPVSMWDYTVFNCKCINVAVLASMPDNRRDWFTYMVRRDLFYDRVNALALYLEREPEIREAFLGRYLTAVLSR